MNADNLITSLQTPATGYRVEDTGDAGQIETPGITEPVTDFSEILERCGFDPETFIVDGVPRTSRWQAQTPDGVQWLTSYKIAVKKKRQTVTTADLIEAIHAHEKPTSRATGTGLMVVAVGDTQIGKADGDGSAGIVRRFKESISRAVTEARTDPPKEILLALLGDCIEGVVSQGGRVIGNSDLTLTEQLRVLRHLVTHAILELMPLCERLHVATVPGNHDETHRVPFESKPTDSFAIDSVRAVEEAFELASEVKPHNVAFHYPEESELALAVEVLGHRFLLAHGHQWRKAGGHFDWWKGQAFSSQTGHDATYLLAGHRHHFEVDTDSRRFYIQVPALESRSDWWRNKTGQVGNPGMVIVRPGEHQPDKIAVV